MARRKDTLAQIRAAARRTLGKSKKRKLGDKLDVTTNFIRERQFDPMLCDDDTYLTGSPAPGLRIVTCKRTDTGKRAVQTILHHKERFKIRHPDLWKQLRGRKTLMLRETHAFGFGGMFAETLDFPNRRAMHKWFVESGYFEKQLAQRKEKSRAKYQRRKAREKADRERKKKGLSGATMNFKDDSSIAAFLAMLAPQGYDGMFRG